jgi:catechol 2,3-dioxygenase-like lactoylglutathione lyase family enzyme
LTFYRDVLGFSVIESVPKEPPFVFVMLTRDNLSVFLNAVSVVREDPAYAKLADAVGQSGISMYFMLKGVRELYDALKGKVTVVAPLERKFYGITEFNIADPDGYLITFAERLD